jgi:hypothetical protein
MIQGRPVQRANSRAPLSNSSVKLRDSNRNSQSNEASVTIQKEQQVKGP